MPDLRLDHIGIQVRGVFLEKPDSLPIKLITPVTPGSHSYGLHHLAFMAPDLEVTLVELGAGGARTLSPPQPGEMFDDELIAVVRAAGINVELITTDRRRGRID